MLYAPRTLSGMADVTALRQLRAAGVPALLYGPPGTGKTSVVEAAFGDVYTVAGDSDTTVADLLGEYTQTPDGRYVFSHGPMVRAMREGRPVFIDDATLIPPSVLAVVYPAMDGRREIIIKAHAGEIVTAAEGFYIIGGHNSQWTELDPLFMQVSDHFQSGSLSVPWMISHRPWCEISSRYASRGWGASARESMDLNHGWWSIRAGHRWMGWRCISVSCGPPGVRRRRCVVTGSTCCAGFGSYGPSGSSGIARHAPKRGTSAAGWRWHASQAWVRDAGKRGR